MQNNLHIHCIQFSEQWRPACSLTTRRGFLYILRSENVLGCHICSALSIYLYFWKEKHTDMNICLLHLCLLTPLLYWSFQDISLLAQRVLCQSAFDRFTLFSTNSSHPRKDFGACNFSADFWPRCQNICQHWIFVFILLGYELKYEDIFLCI